MNRLRLLLSGAVALLILGACSSPSSEPQNSSLSRSLSESEGSTVTDDQPVQFAQPPQAVTEEEAIPTNTEVDSRTWPDGQSQQDRQGNVEVAVKPLNLNNPGPTIDFEVALNTHSVDLSMDLARLATLATDGGLTVTALRWDAPRGGHHVAGVLSFPVAAGEIMFLDEASRLTLTIREVDAAERSFTWAAQE